ncbi:unnamed protein product, partial [Closterium sp. NIES-54]
SPLAGPSPYSGPTRGLTERRAPESRPVSPQSRSASPAPLPPPPLFLVPGPPPVDPLPPQGPTPSGVSQVDVVEPVEVAVDSGAGSGGAEPGGAGSGGAAPRGAESGGAEPGGAESEGAEPGGAEPGSAEPGGEEPGGAGSARVASRSASSRREILLPQELREWFPRRWSRAAGARGTPGAAGTGGAAAAAGVGPAGASGAAGAGAAWGVGVGVGLAGGTAGAAGGTGAAGPAGVGAAGASGAAGAGAAGGVSVGGSPGACPSAGAGVGAVGAEGERREPASRPASPVRAARTSGRAPRQRPPAVPRTHQMALRPSTASQRVPLPSPPESSLPVLADPESDSLRAASPTVARLLSTVVTDPSFESAAASALVAELVDFAACCRLDYTAGLVAESASVCPPSIGGECALSTDVLEDRQEEFQCFTSALPHLVSMMIAPEGDPDAPDIPTPRSYTEAIEGPYSSQWQSAMDAEMASWKSTGTYVDEVPPRGANIVSGMWIFRVKRPPGSPPVFKARYVARGFSQRQGVDYFQTFSPTPKMTTLRVLLHVAAQRDYELHSLDFSTAFLQGSHADASWADDQATQRSSQGYTFSLGSGSVSWRSTRSSSVLGSSCEAEIYARAMAAQELRWLTYLLTDLGEQPRSPPILYVDNKAMLALCREHRLEHRTKHIALRYFLARELQQRGQLRLAYVASEANTADIFTKALPPGDHQRFSTMLGFPTFLHSFTPVHPCSGSYHLFALRYFLARELQQRGQLRLAYVASQANTADIFTKALPPGDHQRFSTMLGLVPTWPHLLTS